MKTVQQRTDLQGLSWPGGDGSHYPQVRGAPCADGEAKMDLLNS